MRRPRLVLLLAVLVLVAGCATRASDSFVKVKLGMTKADLRHTLGEPAKVKMVRFPGHTRSYEIWEYMMVPATPT